MYHQSQQTHSKKPGEERYIYYHPNFNTWYCYTSIPLPYECPISFTRTGPEEVYSTFEQSDTPNPRNLGDIGNVECLPFPTGSPTTDPTQAPTTLTKAPTTQTCNPSLHPTITPSISPSSDPTQSPTEEPTTNPTNNPTLEPTLDPTSDPTSDPSAHPTNNPTSDPTFNPTQLPSEDPTFDPTTNPTVDPTSNPSLDPTSDPTTDPSVDPTADPTSDPSGNPTQYPSEEPTFDPSTEPTADPTDDPTLEPTYNPTHSPSEETLSPSNNPSDSPTKAPIDTLDIYTIININVTINNDANATNEEIYDNVDATVKKYFHTLGVQVDYELIFEVIGNNITDVKIIVFDLQVLETENIESININDEVLQTEIERELKDEFPNEKISVVVTTEISLETYEDQKTFFQQLTFIIGGFLLFVIIISYIDARFVRKNDFYNIGVLMSAAFHILDTISDTMFVLLITYYPDFLVTELFYIFIASIAFIVIPMIITLAQLNGIIDKYWNKSDELRSWLSSHIYKLYVISILCGSSFTGIQLCRSNMFGQPVFDIPLTKQQAAHFHTQRLYSITLLEVSVHCYYTLTYL